MDTKVFLLSLPLKKLTAERDRAEAELERIELDPRGGIGEEHNARDYYRLCDWCHYKREQEEAAYK